MTRLSSSKNVSRHLEKGMTAMQAALLGAREVGFTVLSMSLSLVAVFIPLLLNGRHRRPLVSRIRRRALDRHSRLARRFAYDHGHDVLAFAAVSQTEDHGWLYRVSEKGFAKILGAYERCLQVVLRHPAITLMVLS